MKKILLFTISGIILFGCGSVQKTTNSGKNIQVVEEKTVTLHGPLVFSEGIPVYKATTINYKRKNGASLNIQFNEPIIVSVASKPEKWGYFQFPNIGRKLDGSLQAKWNMTQDAMEAYGIDNSGSANSIDGGKTWRIQEKDEIIGGILLPDGDRLEIFTPKPIKIDNLKLPKPLGSALAPYKESNYNFYKLNDLPNECKGVYLKRLKKGDTEWKTEIASLYDPNAARHSTRGLFPIVWWGDMHVATDGSVIAGVYPGILIRENGSIDPKSGVFFYRSTDGGHSWYIQGRIPYQADSESDAKGDKRSGFTEPAFDILKDGTFLCVMRTTDGEGNGPMYASYSKDLGKTWTKPEVIAATGVLPRLLQLDNGVLVLASGRPGVQLRFSGNGKDITWTDPFEMLPYINENDHQGSCGYTGLIRLGTDRFLVILSDFRYKTQEGNIRKAIKVREVIVKPK